MGLKAALEQAELIFWDFDGVIKESVEIKTEAFCHLFSKYGIDVVAKVKKHHIENGGVSRYKKIPFYYEEYVGLQLDEDGLEQKCNEFSNLVVDQVVACSWVLGVEEYLRTNPLKQKFVLITGTPHGEITTILKSLEMRNVFESVHGAPEEKHSVVEGVLAETNIPAKKTLFLGDAYSDYHAAIKNNVNFYLRKTLFNSDLISKYNLATFDDFTSIYT